MRARLSKTSRNFILLTLLNVITILIFSIQLTNQFRQSSIDMRQSELMRLMSLGLNAVYDIRMNYKTGRVEYEEALERVKSRIRLMTYGSDGSTNYFFMSSYDGIILAHPISPGLEGTSQWDLMDPEGQYVIRDLIEEAGEGSGFITYSFYLPGSSELSEKLSYVVALPEFNAYVGTGILISDIENLNTTYIRKSLLMLLLLCILLITTGILVISPLLMAAKHIGENLDKIGDGLLLEKLPLNAARFRKGSDAHRIVVRFGEFTDKLVELNREVIKTHEEGVKMKEMMMKEMNHRVKNNLQIAISLLKLQSEQTDDQQSREMFVESINRIQSISMLHQMLYQGSTPGDIPGGTYIENLLQHLEASLGFDEHCRLEYDIGETDLTIDEELYLGLLTNELMTNAVKYGCREDRDALIEFSLRMEDGKRLMVFKDNGPGFKNKNDGKVHKSLGMSLIRSMSAQLGGNIEISGDDGASFRLSF